MSPPDGAGRTTADHVLGLAPESLPDGAVAAVLFDMDGTLTDTERLWTISLQAVAHSYGGSISAATREAMVGQDVWVTIDMLHDEVGVHVDPVRTADLLSAKTMEIFRAGLPWRPGAQRLLHEVKAAGVPTALVTATHRQLVDVAMETLGRENFDVVVAGDEVTRNKPDPEPYLRAAELLGLAPSDCLAIEDSPAGSRSASLAGVPVLVVPSEMPVPATDGLVFADSLEDVRVGSLAEFRRRALVDRSPAAH